MEYTKEQIQKMAKIEANDKKHEHIKLDYQDGIYYGFRQGFEKALSLFAVVGRSEQLKCEHKGRRTATELVEYCEDCKKILFHP
jgi:hypothetical protein